MIASGPACLTVQTLPRKPHGPRGASAPASPCFVRRRHLLARAWPTPCLAWRAPATSHTHTHTHLHLHLEASRAWRGIWGHAPRLRDAGHIRYSRACTTRAMHVQYTYASVRTLYSSCNAMHLLARVQVTRLLENRVGKGLTRCVPCVARRRVGRPEQFEAAREAAAHLRA